MKIVGAIYEYVHSYYINYILLYPIDFTSLVFQGIVGLKKFSPLNDVQAFYFIMIVYPYIYFVSFLETPIKIINIPIMMVWYLINPNIFTIKKSALGRN